MMNLFQEIGRLAIKSLYSELILYPKPGLVSLVDQGSHLDMSSTTFLKSLWSLRFYFPQMARAGYCGNKFSELKVIAMDAEKKMFQATHGKNTHRGAIFSLGLLAASAGACYRQTLAPTSRNIRDILLEEWGEDLRKHCFDQSSSNGSRAIQNFQITGAREEAAGGFRSLFEIALPRLSESLREGRTWEEAQVDCLFTLIANLKDTNLYHRGGLKGASTARILAQNFIDHGGTANKNWRVLAIKIHEKFVSQNLSPGGAADLLSATIFVHLSSAQALLLKKQEIEMAL